MKKIFLLLTLYFICFSAAGCSDKGASQSESNNPKAQENTTASSGGGIGVDGNNSPKLQENTTVSKAGIDVDLTEMSSTLVYAEVNNIVTRPNGYMGKTIKISGLYSSSYLDETGKYYHNVIIEDATACCQNGLEFILNGDHTYPDDYPDENTKVEVVGVFDSYDELGQTYYYLAVDDITVLK